MTTLLPGDRIQRLREKTREARVLENRGRVAQLIGLVIESDGPLAAVGELCRIESNRNGGSTLAEVVGFRNHRVLLMPLGDIAGIHPGSEVIALGRPLRIPVGDSLKGRVLNGLGEPLDGLGPIRADRHVTAQLNPPHPLKRERIGAQFEMGIKAIDTFIPCGRGQRMGIFAGSGVGKSTLLGMLARDVRADVNVIALIGERGREVREFVEKHLGEDGLARSVVVVATSDQPALARTRAAHAATAIAESFRDQGRQVLLMMDSITRFAMARREIGLAAGEPPTARGYTPSVFSDIPALCERCGTTDSGGAITALYTVLVEGDDFNEPISDIVRATLDGHIMLSRELAHEGHFPAIDVLQSASRLASELASQADLALMSSVVELMASYERNRQMVDMGAYKAGSNAGIDRAMQLFPAVRAVLRQSVLESSTRQDALARLRRAMGAPR